MGQLGPVTCAVNRKAFKKAFHQKAFDGAEKMLEKLLTDCGFAGGPFTLQPIGKYPGHRPSIRVSRTSESSIRLLIQPGGNDTGWKYDFVLPKNGNLTYQQVADAIHRNLEGGKEESNVVTFPSGNAIEKSSGESSMTNESVGEEALVAEIEVQQPQLTPVDFAKDMAMVANVYMYVFKTTTDTPPLEDLLDAIKTTFKWNEALAMQALRATVTHGYVLALKAGAAGKRYQIASEGFRALLLKNGVPLPPRPEVRGEEIPILNAKAEARAVASQAAEIVPPRRIREATPGQPPNLPPKKAHAPPVALVRSAPVSVPKPPISPGGLAAEVERLDKMAQAFTAAQARATETGPGREVLERAVADAAKVLEAAKGRLAEYDREESSSLQILSDPEYAYAANKLANIKSILGMP